MMINHSTLNYHVTITLTRSVDGSDGQIKNLYSDPNEKFDLLHWSCDVTKLVFRR